jgi:hypothetical protein
MRRLQDRDRLFVFDGKAEEPVGLLEDLGLKRGSIP